MIYQVLDDNDGLNKKCISSTISVEAFNNHRNSDLCQ